MIAGVCVICECCSDRSFQTSLVIGQSRIELCDNVCGSYGEKKTKAPNRIGCVSRIFNIFSRRIYERKCEAITHFAGPAHTEHTCHWPHMCTLCMYRALLTKCILTNGARLHRHFAYVRKSKQKKNAVILYVLREWVQICRIFPDYYTTFECLSMLSLLCAILTFFLFRILLQFIRYTECYKKKKEAKKIKQRPTAKVAHAPKSESEDE